MADDPFYAPGARAAPRVPRPGELLWSARVNNVTWSAELRYHGEYGVEAQILRNGELVIGRRFDRRQSATSWAEQERLAIERNDWKYQGE